MSGERQLKIIRERYYLRESDALGRLHGIARHGRSDGNLVHFKIDAEVLERAFDDVRICLDIADPWFPFIGTENRERGRVVFSIKVRYTAPNAGRMIKHGHDGLMFCLGYLLRSIIHVLVCLGDADDIFKVLLIHIPVCIAFSAR